MTKILLTKQALAELIGMTMFVYIGTGSVISTGEQLATSAAPTASSVARVLPISFAFGMSIMVQAYSFGHISGGHFNPAVTYCLYLMNKVDLKQLLCYVAAQITGAILGSLLLWGSVSQMNEDRSSVIVEEVIGSPPFGLGANGLNPALSPGNGFVLEFMGTLLLCCTVMMTTSHSQSLARGVPHAAPIAIGFAVFLAHIVLVPLTGCGINPARTLGPAIVNSFAGNNVFEHWSYIYYIGPLSASVVTALLYKFVFAPEVDDTLDSKATKEVEEAPVADI